MNYNKRLITITYFIILFFILTIGRLIFFQLIKSEQLLQEVINQRSIKVKLKNIRGNIYDRNMIPFTEREDSYYAIVMASHIDKIDDISNKLSQYTRYNSNEIKALLTSSKKPVKIIIDKEKESILDNIIDHPEIKIIEVSKRYGEESLARHMIGYVNDLDNVGYYGLEKTFDKYLRTEKEQVVKIIGDVANRSIPGLGYRLTKQNNNNKGLLLTLDYHIQNISEKIANLQLQSGAVIISEIKTGNILAVTSRPNFIQTDIKNHINSNGDELINKAFCAYDAGSIFKIITAAAGLEEKKVSLDTAFNCNGVVNVTEKEFMCHKEEGHGEINFLHAFAHSCNIAFIELGLQIGYNPIMDMARRFGLGKAVKIYDGLEQDIGNIPQKKYVSNREIANISIGQGEILITPIQALDMVMTIANNGIRKKVNIVDSIIDDKGTIFKKISINKDEKIIDKKIAQDIQKAMQEVVISGTGQMVTLQEYGGAGGKTASAETGWIVNNQAKVHGWFAGYFPAEAPRYAMVVFAEDGKQGGTSAAPVFKEIAEEMLKMGY